jgi:hypothetical protein
VLYEGASLHEIGRLAFEDVVSTMVVNSPTTYIYTFYILCPLFEACDAPSRM